MVNKTKRIKTWFLLAAIFTTGLLSYLIIINADRNLSFTNLNQNSLKAKFSQIHFNASGNDFGGGIFWLASETYNQPISLQFQGTSEIKKCKKQLRGIYYNNARGARLWPLDQKTLNLLSGSPGYTNLSLTGGLYTSCEGNEKYSIFGYIKYTLGSSTTSYLIAGTKLDYTANKYIPEFKDNFQYFNNEAPLGFFWDSVGGIGFVGGSISGNQDLLTFLNDTGTINSAFKSNTGIVSVTSSWGLGTGGSGNASDTMWNLLVQGNTILSKAIDALEKKSLVGNLEKRTVLLSSSDINSSTIINLAKKNAEILCRGVGYTIDTNNNSTIGSSSNDVICFKDSHDLVLDLLGNKDRYDGKTIILKNSNLTLKGSMDETTPPIDVFIDGGNLYVNGIGNKMTFNIQGFPSTIDVVSKGVFLKGNFIINGLLIGGDPDHLKSITNKTHLQGKFISLNTPSEASDTRTEQVSDVLGSSAFNDWISLENVFTWFCDPTTGNGSDYLSTCGQSDEVITTIPFVILDGTFPSKILK